MNKEVIRLRVVSRPSANLALAELLARKGEEPFVQRLAKERGNHIGFLSETVDKMTAYLCGLYSLQYSKDEDQQKDFRLRFKPYADFVRTHLYKGSKKADQMGKLESELMFIGAMIKILAPTDPERLVFIRLWNGRNQKKFWFDEPGAR